MGVIPPSEVFLRVQPVLDFLTLASALLLHGRGEIGAVEAQPGIQFPSHGDPVKFGGLLG